MELGGIGGAELIAMRHDDLKPVQLHLGDLRQLRPNVEAVAVAEHRRHRRERLQLHQEIQPSYIPAVEDVVHLPEDGEDFRPQHAMGVGDDAESHRNAKTRSPLNFLRWRSQGKRITTRNSTGFPVGARSSHFPLCVPVTRASSHTPWGPMTMLCRSK